MSDDTKFYLGLKLNVGLITPKEIQAWADKRILEDSSDEFALDICFLGSDVEVKKYFNKLVRSDLDVYESPIAISVLKEYISKKYPSELELDQYTINIDLISTYIDDSDLIEILNIYGDQINLASLGYLTISVKEAFDEFSKHLNEWLKTIHLT
jgi:hypothetical protein